MLPELIETGLITAADVEQWRAGLADPAFVDIPQFTLAAWGDGLPSATSSQNKGNFPS